MSRSNDAFFFNGDGNTWKPISKCSQHCLEFRSWNILTYHPTTDAKKILPYLATMYNEKNILTKCVHIT